MWKPIVDPEFEKTYEASDSGIIRCVENGEPRELRPLVSHWGYSFVRIRSRGRRRNIAVHQLVARAFLPNPDNKPIVNHKDSNPRNNALENLEWVTHKENSQHARRAGRFPTGENHPNSKLTDAQYAELVGEIAKREQSLTAIAKRFGLSVTHVSAIWRNGGKRAKPAPRPGHKPYAAKTRQYLPWTYPDSVVASVWAAVARGESQRRIASQLGVSKRFVARVVGGERAAIGVETLHVVPPQRGLRPTTAAAPNVVDAPAHAGTGLGHVGDSHETQIDGQVARG